MLVDVVVVVVVGAPVVRDQGQEHDDGRRGNSSTGHRNPGSKPARPRQGRKRAALDELHNSRTSTVLVSIGIYQQSYIDTGIDMNRLHSAERGSPSDGPHDRLTGTGYVAASTDHDYADALSKKRRVTLFLSFFLT